MAFWNFDKSEKREIEPQSTLSKGTQRTQSLT